MAKREIPKEITEEQARTLASFGALCEIEIRRATAGARAESVAAGWGIWVNGAGLKSARRAQRIFASADAAAALLEEIGFGSETSVRLGLSDEAPAKAEPKQKKPSR